MAIIIGYARVSTKSQSTDAQIDQLTAPGCAKIYEEKESGAKSDRLQLAALMDYVREGDTVVATRVDRVERSIRDLLSIVNRLKEEGAAFKVFSEAYTPV